MDFRLQSPELAPPLLQPPLHIDGALDLDGLWLQHRHLGISRSRRSSERKIGRTCIAKPIHAAKLTVVGDMLDAIQLGTRCRRKRLRIVASSLDGAGDEGILGSTPVG